MKNDLDAQLHVSELDGADLGQLAPGDAENGGFEVSGDDDGQHNVREDELKGRELNAGGEPVDALRGRHIDAEFGKRLGGAGVCAANRGRVADAREKREGWDLILGGNLERTVVTETGAQAGDEKAGRPSDRGAEAGEHE